MFAKSTSGSVALTAGSTGLTSVIPKNFTGKLANFSARHRWTVLGAWVAALVVTNIPTGSHTDARYSRRMPDYTVGNSGRQGHGG